MYNLAGNPSFKMPSTPTFTDVPKSSQYYTSIEWMSVEKITSGTSATTYSPSNPVTREQMAVFMYALANSHQYCTTHKTGILC